MISAQDHKRIFDNDEGPIRAVWVLCPGSGLYAGHPKSRRRHDFTTRRRRPQSRRHYLSGLPLCRLMITEDGPKVVEFNCRFGDPETQAVLPLLDGDLAQIMYACTKGTLSPDMVHWKDASACCVIMASAGYPASSHKGDVISASTASTAMIRWYSIRERPNRMGPM